MGFFNKKKVNPEETSQESTGSKVAGFVSKGISRLMPRGGFRTPDSLVRHRELYAGNGRMPDLIPGVHPRADKSLLVGNSPRRTTSPTMRKVPLYPGQFTGEVKKVRKVRRLKRR